MNIQNDKKQQKRDLYAIDDASALFEAIGAEPLIDDSDDSDDDLMNADGMFDPNKILDVKPYEGPESGSRFPQEEIPEFNDEEKQFVVEQAAQKLASLPDKKISLEDLAQVATVIKGENGFRQDVYEFLKNTINESEKRLAAQNVSQEQPSGVVSAENTGADATVTTDAIPPMVEVQPTVPEKTPDLTPIVGKETIPDSLGVQSNDTLDIDNINAIGNETNDIGDVGADDLSALGFNTDSTDDTENSETKDTDSSVDNDTDTFSIDGLDKLADADFAGDSDTKETEDTKTETDEKKDETKDEKKDSVKDTDEKKDDSALESVDTKTKAVTESENGDVSLSEDGISDSTDASDSTDEVMTESKNKLDCEKKAKLESVRNDYINKCEQKKKAIALESIIEQCDTELNGGINKKQRLIATLESISTKYKQENRTERLNAIVESYNKGKKTVENISKNDKQDEKKAKLESVANIYKETVKKNDEIDKKLNAVLIEAQAKLKTSNEKEQIKNNFKKLNEQKDQIKNKL